MKKFIFAILPITLFIQMAPSSASTPSAQTEVEIAIDKTKKYIYSDIGSLRISSANAIFGGAPKQFDYIRDMKNSYYLYNQGNEHRFIKDANGTYLHSSYLVQNYPFDKMLSKDENVMYLVPEKFNNFYLYGKNEKNTVDNAHSYFAFLGLMDHFRTGSEYTNKSDTSYHILDKQANEEVEINLNSEGYVTQITFTNIGEQVPFIAENYSYEQIDNILSLLPKYDFKNLDIYAQTDQYNTLYFSRLIKDNLSDVYSMAGIQAKRLDKIKGTVSIRDIKPADIKKFLGKNLRDWYSSVNSISTVDGIKQVGDKLQQSIKGYNNKVYTGCLSKKGNELIFVLAKC